MSFFSLILKQKKLTIFTFLFFVFTAIILPQTTFAIWINPFSWFDDAANGVANAIIYVFLFVPVFLTAVFADIAGIILKLALFISTSGISYTQSPAVNIGWPIVRDLANMVVVLGFVVIGIATTLRIQEYQAKKTLFPLIIAALLINFSLLVCGIFIDASNIATNFFFSKIGNTSFGLDNIVNSFKILGNSFTDNWTAFGAKLISMAVFNFFIFFILLLYAVLILGRIVALWILVILSPLAFVCYVFPFTKNIWQMWWKNFSQWCIIGIPAGFFLYIGSQMMEGIITTPAPAFTPSSSILSLDTLKTLGGFFSFLLPGLFLIIGFLVSLQFSAMGASEIMNFANKNKGKIIGGGFKALSKTSGRVNNMVKSTATWMENKGGRIGAIGKGAGWAWDKTLGKGAGALGDYRATSQKTRSTLGRILEGAGAIPIGTMAEKQNKELATAISALTAALKSGNKQDQQRVFDKITNGTGIDKTAAILTAVGEGKLHEAFKDSTGRVNYHAMNNAMVNAEKSGAPMNMRKDAENKYYQLAEFGDKNVDAALTSLGFKGQIDTALGANAGKASPAERMTAARSILSTADISRAEGKANYIKLTQNWGSMDTNARANTNLGQLHQDDLKEFALSRNAEDIKAFRSLDASHSNRSLLRSLLGDISTEAATASTNKKRRLDEVHDEINKL